MSKVLAGIPGVLCDIDDILISGSRLQEVLECIHAAGLTLNKQKCEFSRDYLSFLGHIIDNNGISPDPEKTAAINEMETPQTPTELRRFMGMVNQLGKFTPHIAQAH